MNLARVLEDTVSVPKLNRLEKPRPHPKLVVREHLEHDGKIFTMCIPGGRPPHYFRLTEMQWNVVQLFNGERTTQDVIRLAASQYGLSLTQDDVNAFVEALEDCDFWYHTPQEQSVALCHHLMQERQRRNKKDSDMAQIILCAFDPDRYLNWVNRHFSWIYSRWFTGWSVFMLLVACVILGSHWRQVWADSLSFYNMAGRGFGHFVNFLIAFLLLGAVHETAHGLTCKHYGGEVHRMGAMLVYLAPCIYCDVSQVYVYGGRWERMMTTFFGVWSEVVISTYAAVIWWATPPGSFLHDWSYLIILAGGIFCVIVNWNPFAKMDGYMLFTEYFRIHDIKATSTQWLISWIRVNVFHLPGIVPPMTRWRKIWYSGYALLSGFYCYMLLLFFVRILYHIVQYYSPTWAFVPAWALALVIFRSRIQKLGHFMREVYLDKKPLLMRHKRALIAGAVALVVLGILPLRRDRVTERFVVEPAQRAVLRALVPGRVLEVKGDEGQHVAAGTVLMSLRDLGVQTEAARANAEYQQATARAFDAQLRYADYGSAEQQRTASLAVKRLATAKEQQLAIVSPIAGVLVTPRMHDLVGSYVGAGAQLAEVADLSSVRARIFVPEHEMQKLKAIQGVTLRMDSEWGSQQGQVVSISPSSQPPDEGLMEKPDYQGIKAPEFFVVTVALPNPSGTLRDGMTGTAKILGNRRSVLGVWLEPLLNAAARRVW